MIFSMAKHLSDGSYSLRIAQVYSYSVGQKSWNINRILVNSFSCFPPSLIKTLVFSPLTNTMRILSVFLKARMAEVYFQHCWVGKGVT